MIGQGHGHHNSYPASGSRFPAAAIVCLVAVGLVAGCGEGGSNGKAREARAAAKADLHDAAACPLVTTTYGLDAFFSVGERMRAEGADALAEGNTVGELPVWLHWRRSYEPETIPSQQLGLTILVSALGRNNLPPELKAKRYRPDFVTNQGFVLDQRDRIERFLAELIADEFLCELPERVEGWVRPEDFPDTLKVDFLAFAPEIRLYEGRFLVDAGLAFISGRQQLVNLLAGTLYRKVGAIAGPNPADLEGEAIVAHVLRILHNEGIASYLDDMPNLSFGNEHPALSKAAPVPERMCETARRSLQYVDETMAKLLALPAGEVRDFLPVHRYFIGARSWQSSGWFMAQVIAERSGESRLQKACGSVRDFLRAYQEAATQKTAVSAPPGSVDWHVQSAPTFRPEVYEALLRIVDATFDDPATH